MGQKQGGRLKRSATVSIKLPQEVINIISDFPDKLLLITVGYGDLSNGSVALGNIRYSMKLADNKKYILVSDLNKYYPVSDKVYQRAYCLSRWQRLLK
ncbi:hypothetical protein BN440_3585 [Erwinia amylovora MR1]|nr:hypothetical protein BN440_3585 [Erwinia amylovora MR1]